MSLFSDAAAPAFPLLAQFQEVAVEWILDLLALRGGALLADEVGLGKSWVAAAVARVWEDRGGSAEIVVPAPLLAQWRQIADEFGLAATVVSHDALATRAAVAGPRERLMIVDEAHRLRNPRTARYRAMALRARGATVLLVTATPICNTPDDLRALLALFLADDALADRGVASLDEAFRLRSETQLREVVGELAVRRGGGVLPEALRFTRASRIEVPYRPAGELGRELSAILRRLEFPLLAQSGAGLLRAFLWRRLESSLSALRSTLERLRRLHARALECALRGVAMTGATYRAAFGDRDAPMFQDLLFPELWGLGGGAAPVDARELRRELAVLEAALRFLSDSFTDDPKVDLVTSVVAGFPGRRGLVFSQSRDTARAIWSSLRLTLRCALVTGAGCRRHDGELATPGMVFELLSRGELDVVVATDVGCEGLNLQDATWVVHADLPWNPSKLEQRIGRVSRIGQTAEHVDDVVLVAERSPVADAIERKLGERRRMMTARPGDECARSSARIDGISIAAGNAELCVVDVLERRGRREGIATRVVECDGSAGSVRDGRERGAAMTGVAPATRSAIAEVGSAVERYRTLTRSRELQPAHVAVSSAQARLLDAAERSGDATRDLVDALSRRYQAGAEILVAETAAGPVDACSIEALVRALRAEAPERAMFEASVRGCGVTRSWIRSATLLRRRLRR